MWNISFIDHSKPIDPRKNLNNSKLYLNIKGSIKYGIIFPDISKTFPVEKVIRKATLKSDTIKTLLEKHLLLSEMKILDLKVLLITSL